MEDRDVFHVGVLWAHGSLDLDRKLLRESREEKHVLKFVRGMVRDFHDLFGIWIATTAQLPPATSEDRRDFMDIAKKLRAAADHAMFSAGLVRDEPDGELRHLSFIRLQLMAEELAEVAEAMYHYDIVEVAHELADLDYVVQGTILTFGLDSVHEECVSEIHKANLSKLEDGKPIINNAGRVVKGKNFRRADCTEIIRRHREACL